jgi:PKD repeat protein
MLVFRRMSPRRDSAARRYRAHGQSLVEFALVLPVLLLIVLVGLDFGRSFLGWVGLNNAARIAANYASLHPTAWGSPGNATYRTEYAQLVTNDFQGAGCTVPNPVPTPAFLDAGSTDLGSRVSVSLPCSLPLVTPVIGGFFPSGVPITGGAIFAVRGGIIAGSGGAGAAPAASCAATPSEVNTGDPVTLTNNTPNPGAVTNWYWDFGDGNVSIAQNPGTHAYTAASNYQITLNATNTFGTTQGQCGGTIEVKSLTLAADFTWAPASPTSGTSVTFTGSASGGSPSYTWSWVFGDGGTATGPNPSHTFAGSGSFTVTATVTDSVGAKVTPTHAISVSKTCLVPPLIGTDTQHAQKAWSDAGFATNVNFNPGTGQGNNYTIGNQTTNPISGPFPCNTTQIEVTP